MGDSVGENFNGCEDKVSKQERFKTNYPGVFYVQCRALGRMGTEKIYYIRYRREGKLIEEKAGRQFVDDMTPARAAGIRAQRIEGKQKSNTQQRDKVKSKITIDDIAIEYFAQRDNGKSAYTDSLRYKKYLKSQFGPKEPKDLVKLDTDRLRINLLKKRSTQTVKHVLALLKRLVNFGVDRGICKGTSFKITMPLVDNVKTEDLTSAQLQDLLEVIETTSYQTAAKMMKLALFTGMRRGEMFKLKWSDIDLHRGFVHIREPKGGKSQKIPLNSNTRQLVEEISRDDIEYVFPGRGGGPRISISRDVRAIRDEAGLPKDFRPLHGLRHLYATMLASSGKVDMFTLQKLLTHKSPSMTLRYAHHRDEALQRAAEEVGNILSDAMQVKEKKNVV